MLDLFPNPRKAPSRLGKPTNVTVLFRLRHLSDEKPKMGFPQCVCPGDMVTFYDDQHRSVNRYAKRLIRGGIVVEAMTSGNYILDEEHDVLFGQIYEVRRPEYQ